MEVDYSFDIDSIENDGFGENENFEIGDSGDIEVDGDIDNDGSGELEGYNEDKMHHLTPVQIQEEGKEYTIENYQMVEQQGEDLQGKFHHLSPTVQIPEEGMVDYEMVEADGHWQDRKE